MEAFDFTALQEATAVLYGLSIVFYFIHFLYRSKKAEKIALIIVAVVWFLQSAFLTLYIFETNRFPILTLFEGIYFYAWILVTLSLILHFKYKQEVLVVSINILGFIMVTIHTFAPIQVERSPELLSELLFIHITFAIVSYAAFSLAFVFAVLHQILYRLLKKKKWTLNLRQMPSLGQTEQGMTVAMAVGIPFLFLSILLGIEWAFVSLNSFSFGDIKIIGSFVILLFYSVLLYRHQRRLWQGSSYARAHIYAFLLVLLNFFLGSRLSEFHFWI